MADFTSAISYNKTVQVRDGVCSITVTSKDGNSSQTTVLEREVVVEILGMRSAMEGNLKTRRESTYTFRGGNSVRTAFLRFRHSGDRNFMAIFSFRNEEGGKQDIWITEEKFANLMEALHCYIRGSKPINAVSEASIDDLAGAKNDLDEIYRIVLSNMFAKRVGLARKSMCYGCENDRPSQKDHDYCMDSSDLDVSDTVFEKFISKDLLITTTLVAFQIWQGKIDQRNGLEELLEYLCDRRERLPYDYAAVLKVMENVKENLIDRGKLRIVGEVTQRMS